MRHATELEYGAIDGLWRAREREARGSERARAAKEAFLARLPEGLGALGILPRDMRADAELTARREAYRAAHREAMTARDEAAGFACDLETAGAETP